MNIIRNFESYTNTFRDSGFAYMVVVDDYENGRDFRVANLYVPEQNSLFIYVTTNLYESKEVLDNLEMDKLDLLLTAVYDLENHVLSIDSSVLSEGSLGKDFVNYVHRAVYSVLEGRFVKGYRPSSSLCLKLSNEIRKVDISTLEREAWEMTVV